MADNNNGGRNPGGAPPLDSARKDELAAKSAKDKKILIIIIACVSLVMLALILIIISTVAGKAGQGSDFSTAAPLTAESITAAPPEQGLTAESSSLLQTEPQTQPAETAAANQTAVPETQAPPAGTAPASEKQNAAETAPTEQTTELYTIEGLEPLTKTGDNMLSDSKDNEFIKIVSEKYGIEPEKLVAIYAVPDKGNNFVLEFSGETDADGNIIKSPDTLYRIHLVDLKRNVKTATGKMTGNKGVSYAEGLLTMQMIKGLVMPQHADYFTGVEPKE